MTQEDFIELANEWKNISLTWIAWSWKTYILNKWKLDNSHKKIITVAPTGIAAINAWGVTIHSAFKLYWDNYHAHMAVQSASVSQSIYRLTEMLFLAAIQAGVRSF